MGERGRRFRRLCSKISMRKLKLLTISHGVNKRGKQTDVWHLRHLGTVVIATRDPFFLMEMIPCFPATGQFAHHRRD
jgi:hypothetical protein